MPETTPPPGHRRMSVREDGATVIIEIECRDAYEAIRLAETVAAGIKGDGFTLDFGKGAANAG